MTAIISILLSIFGWVLKNPLTSILGVSVIGLGITVGVLKVKDSYLISENQNLQVQLDTDKRVIADWQSKFNQLQIATNDCNTKVTELQKKDEQLQTRIDNSNKTIENYEQELQADAKKIAAQILPADCSNALSVLIDNTKTNVSKLKIQREIK